MTKWVPFIALAGVVSLTGCEGFSQAMSSHTNLLARAGGHELTVDRAAELIAPHGNIPAQPEVVEAVADLWVDYILVASEVARDSTLGGMSLDAIVQPTVDSEMVWKLREQVINVDSVIPEAELRAMYEADMPGGEIRARHILFRVPEDATPEVRDSIQSVAEGVRQRAAGGGDFAELAREHSQDGTAQEGGDLGFFQRGQMMGPFEEAAFALEPGEVSPQLVQTPFGLHIIRVEERRVPDFEEMRADYMHSKVVEREQGAEEAYITALTDTMDVEVQEGAAELAKELADRTDVSLGRRAAARPLVSYRGGALTAQEFQQILRTAVNIRQQLPQAPDDEIEAYLLGLARHEILIREARRQGLQPTEAEVDSLRIESRGLILDALRQGGLTNITPQDGESTADAVERKVMALLDGILRGESNLIPLGPVTFALRDEHGAEIHERAIPAVVERIEELRPAGAQPGMPGTTPPPPPAGDATPPAGGGTPPPDTGQGAPPPDTVGNDA